MLYPEKFSELIVKLVNFETLPPLEIPKKPNPPITSTPPPASSQELQSSSSNGNSESPTPDLPIEVTIESPAAPLVLLSEPVVEDEAKEIPKPQTTLAMTWIT